MDTHLLTSMGLTEPQAKAYICLIKEGSLTPPVLANKIKESRSNAYKILDRLVEIGIANKSEVQKKFVYRPENPIVLEELSHKARQQILAREKQVKDSMPTLLNYFYTYSEQPGIRFFQGKDGLSHVFDDMLRTGKDIYLLRSPADIKFYDESFYDAFRKKRAKLGIITHALTPDLPTATHNEAIDEANKFIRTWLPKDAYTAPVEWNVYGNKVAIISYGEEAIATIIESPQITESFRQVFSLLEMSAQSRASAK